MEKVLDSKICNPESKLVKNGIGLYDLTVTDEHGTVVASVRNATFLTAVGIIEERMYTSGKARSDI